MINGDARSHADGESCKNDMMGFDAYIHLCMRLSNEWNSVMEKSVIRLFYSSSRWII